MTGVVVGTLQRTRPGLSTQENSRRRSGFVERRGNAATETALDVRRL